MRYSVDGSSDQLGRGANVAASPHPCPPHQGEGGGSAEFCSKIPSPGWGGVWGGVEPRYKPAGLNTRHQYGFTLIELLVVLVMLALLYGVAAPAVFSASERQKVSGATASLYHGLRRARGEAIARGRPVSRDPVALAGDSEVTIARAGKYAGPVIFYPDGSATAAHIDLALGVTRRAVTVDWLTGHVALGE